MILLIDNYDSFSYNLYQLIGALTPDVAVIRNDVCTVDEIASMDPSRIILSPGPGRPENAGVCMSLIGRFAGIKPILGVCLGHQAICEAFGSPVVYAARQMHGKQSDIEIDNGNELFRGLPPVIKGARYHSLAVDAEKLKEPLRVIGRADDGEIMAVCHREYGVYGVQFHPESILTPHGKTIIQNFLSVGAMR
ncbi:MAG: aminodeoxychorismate/anthranilate synthase component II [Clostridiales bacterium]|jgi:anthranilate synthase component 2|nr:aminodeoxychorismate/anthranilate synthase component II [Clostridiales bacterium]